YLASTYDELRTGFEVYFRKRLIELVEGRISYRYEIVDIFDVKPDAPSPIVEGERSVSKVGFSLLRDTRDSILAATRGNRVELLTEVAGGPFQGETHYFRIEGRAAQFFPTFETLNQVFSIVGRLGTVIPHSGADEVPFFDRYFLGGPYDLRGFDYRDVGPSEGSDRIGGNSFGFVSAEYS